MYEYNTYTRRGRAKAQCGACSNRSVVDRHTGRNSLHPYQVTAQNTHGPIFRHSHSQELVLETSMQEFPHAPIYLFPTGMRCILHCTGLNSTPANTLCPSLPFAKMELYAHSPNRLESSFRPTTMPVFVSWLMGMSYLSTRGARLL